MSGDRAVLAPANTSPFTFFGLGSDRPTVEELLANKPPTPDPPLVWADCPKITEGPAVLGDLRQELRFQGWEAHDAVIDVYAGGHFQMRLKLEATPEGVVRMASTVGSFTLTAIPGDSRRAKLTSVVSFP